MPNRLAHESSPYLLQHAGNPVDWYPWGDEALTRAVTEEKPIFLSIGYSACHWCHVMEHESFENEQIARLLNEHFVSIKVDREERPDLDQIYMNAVQLLTGHGGWPMSVFLTPDKKPFYGGTYWPPAPRHGMPGFSQVLVAVAEAWRERRQQAYEQADSLTQHLKLAAAPPLTPDAPDLSLVESAAAALASSFDPTHGGFGGAPKFPHPMDLRLLLRAWKRQPGERLMHVVAHTLDRMAAGGIYDHLGGGFHRYSVDERWLVPHFEKMLYDNALLIPCYVEAFQVTGNEQFARVARETCDYLLREMTSPEGGFFSTTDADSEGEEGKFFVWTPEEIAAVLGSEAGGEFCAAFDVTPRGNFEHGKSILNRSALPALESLSPSLAASREKLRVAREARVHPHLDDKILVAWNGLAIEALALAAGALGEPRYLAAAQRAAQFVLKRMRRADGRLWHSWRAGQARHDAYLDDYAALALALVALYETDFDERWLDEAAALARIVLGSFADPAGGFFYTADDHEALIVRQKDLYDNATPSGNSLAACLLVRLAKLTGSDEFSRAAEAALRAATPIARQAPRATAQLLLAVDMWLGPTHEIAIVGDPNHPPTRDAIARLHQRFIPNKVVACRAPASAQVGSPLLSSLFVRKTSSGPEPTVYICQNFACQAPVYGPEGASTAWKVLAAGEGKLAFPNSP